MTSDCSNIDLGRQHDVRLARRVGHELIDDHAEVERAKRLEHGVGLGVLRDRIAALDPDHAQRRVVRRQHRRPSRAVEIETRTTPSGSAGG